MTIPPIEFGGQGPLIHFLHANGYPPETYRQFLSLFTSRYRVMASYLRPLWPGSDPKEIEDWIPFREDLLNVIKRLPSDDKVVIAMGHSIGATVSLMAALKDPDRFWALVLIEPVLFPPWINLSFRLLNLVGLLKRVHPLIQRTLRRQRVFENEQIMFENYREKRVFGRISDQVLQDYVQGLARPRPDGKVELAYPPAWEAKIYQTGGLHDHRIWRTLNRCELPVLLVRGEETDTLRMKAVRMMEDRLPQLQILNLPDTGHLVPLEAPERVQEHILEFLQSL